MGPLPCRRQSHKRAALRNRDQRFVVQSRHVRGCRMTKGRPTTIFEVAHAAGVSLGTASKAMNGNGRISLATRERVLQAAKTLGFRPNPIARGLITGRSSTVGMIMVDSMTHRIALPIMLGAESALAEIELSMISADARGDVECGIALAVSYTHLTLPT